MQQCPETGEGRKMKSKFIDWNLFGGFWILGGGVILFLLGMATGII